MLQYDRQMQSPIIEPYVKQYTLDKGTGSVPFRCVSSSPISWYREENSPWTSTVQATCSSTSNQSNGSHCASIAFTNASIEQVGRYYCAKDAEVRQYREQYGWTNDETLRLHLADLEAEFHATSFYLFVDDPEQPLVPGNSIISIGHVLHVPCKPTTPRAEVDLINMDGNPVTGVYSSTDGVIISSGPYSYHNRFFCRDHFAKQHEVIFKNRSDDFEDKPHFSSIDKYAITFETEVKKGYLYPLLDLDFKVTAAYNVIPSGAWVHLVCGSGFGRQKLSIIPAAAIVEKVNKTLQRVLSTVTKSPITRMEQAAIKELVIESATVEHSGTYRCETPTLSHTNVTYFSSVKLYVLNSTEDFIYFSEGNTNATSIRVPKEFRTDGHSKPVTIAINYEYYAAEVNCSWFRDGMPTEALCGNWFRTVRDPAQVET
ncbi:AGAP008813-PA-like protein [Anopheles sinensis]|uniref:Platelet-derived growth factor receptor-like protein n=1 Tax=Anopheles sinensis TaxID=74873 RepID=A0A084VCV4_ANOSI|nr:AGAP008813-PA-like protein [Anopheles sinensis]